MALSRFLRILRKITWSFRFRVDHSVGSLLVPQQTTYHNLLLLRPQWASSAARIASRTWKHLAMQKASIAHCRWPDGIMHPVWFIRDSQLEHIALWHILVLFLKATVILVFLNGVPYNGCNTECFRLKRNWVKEYCSSHQSTFKVQKFKITRFNIRYVVQILDAKLCTRRREGDQAPHSSFWWVTGRNKQVCYAPLWEDATTIEIPPWWPQAASFPMSPIKH